MIQRWPTLRSPDDHSRALTRGLLGCVVVNRGDPPKSQCRALLPSRGAAPHLALVLTYRHWVPKRDLADEIL
jgi:hypothetical protein